MSPSTDAAGARTPVLLCQTGAFLCALPLGQVSETMRPLPVQPLAVSLPFVDGLAIIRGAPVPVVALSRLLGHETDGKPARFAVVKVGERRVALAVRSVVGVRSVETASLSQLPRLLQGAHAELVGALGALDAELLLVLDTAKLLPASFWDNQASGAA